jgi:arginyl-tRNA synthetase
VTHLEERDLSDIAKFEVVEPGFINIHFSEVFLNANVADIVAQGEEFGRGDSLKGQRWVVEHTSPNPNKAMHLGHLRNNLVGMSLRNVLIWSGAEVMTDEIDNNRGIAIAKMMYGFLAHMKKDATQPTDVTSWLENKDGWYSPEEKDLSPDIFVTQCYVEGEKLFKASKESEQVTREMVIKWEDEDPAVWKLWEHVLSFAYSGINRTLDRLGSHFDKVWHEHEHYKEGKNYVEVGLAKGIFHKLDDGAVLTNLESKYGLPDTVLLKRDGTSLYITQDIALTALKKDYYKADTLVWVVGPDQTLALRQVFAVCEQLGIGELKDFKHVSYGYVTLASEGGGTKRMSSREGTVVLIDDVIDEVKKQIEVRAKEHGGEKISGVELSEKLAMAAVKFSILRPDRMQDITFDINQSVSIHGDSGVYVMYSYVRAISILEKNTESISENLVEIGDEKELLRLLTFFPRAVDRARADLSAHHIATYLLEISSAFNSWYAKEPILDGSLRENHKLAVTKATSQVLKNGLSILGIQTVSKM